ncbi:MAG: sigma-70 family RNA polymerase sigma factor [Planctomycetes bacterium]|nr:sigma-70 family RNA polymerase sigma factor [Planctomycetota bacterium]
MSADPDTQLMLRVARGGDREAFAQLVNRNAPKVHALVYRFLGNAEQAEDMAQDVFMRVYKTAASYQPTAKFGTWLYRIVANLSFNVLRSRRISKTVNFQSLEGPDEETGRFDVADTNVPQPHCGLDDQELRTKVMQAVNQLPENQRLAIILSKYEEKSYEDIAEIMDISAMAVKSLLSRARNNLHEALFK